MQKQQQKCKISPTVAIHPVLFFAASVSLVKKCYGSGGSNATSLVTGNFRCSLHGISAEVISSTKTNEDICLFFENN